MRHYDSDALLTLVHGQYLGGLVLALTELRAQSYELMMSVVI